MFPQQITDLQQYRVPEPVFAIPFVCNIAQEVPVPRPVSRLSLFFFNTYSLFDGRRGSCGLPLIVLQPRPLFLVVHRFQT